MKKAAMPGTLGTITGPLFMAALGAGFPGKVRKDNILRITFTAATHPTAAMFALPHHLTAGAAAPTTAILT